MAWNQDFGAGANPGTDNSEWRKNFNGGWAAGDWTGNHNAKHLADKIASGEGFTKDEVKLAPDHLKPVVQVIDAVRPRPGTAGGTMGGGALTGGNVTTTVPVDVVKAAMRTVRGMPQITGFNWGQIGTDLQRLWAGGGNAHVLATDAKKHEQGLIGGHRIVHDLGWSPMEVMEDIYGDAEFLTPTWFYSWAKQLADLQKTAEANNYPGPKDALDELTTNNVYTGTPQAGDPFWDAGNAVGNWARDTWNSAETGWNTMVNWSNNQVPLSNSSPGPRNPYANSSAYPF